MGNSIHNAEGCLDGGWRLEDDFVESGLLVSGPGDDILVIRGNVAAQYR